MRVLLNIFLLVCFLPAKGQRLIKPLNFSGELVPHEVKFIQAKLYNQIVIASRSKTRLAMLKEKGNFYFPFIEAMLKKHGIPEDFKYLPIIESDFTRSALSHAGAKGFWQLMPGTAQDLGLSVQSTVDERESIVRSTNAACKHLKYLYKELKNWTLVAAAYNVGLGSLRASIRKQKIGNYYFLKLNSETGEYVYKLLAIKILFNETSKVEILDSNQPIKPIENIKKPGFNSGYRKKMVELDSTIIKVE